MSWLKETKAGTWRYKVSLGFNSNIGRYESIYGTEKTKELAKKKIRDIEYEHERGTYVVPGKIKTGEFLVQWLRDYVKPNNSPTTYQGYEYIVRYHLVPSLGHFKLTDLKSQHIQNYIAEKQNTVKANKKGKLSPTSIRHQIMVLHKALETAINPLRLLAFNPAERLILPTAETKDMETWDDNEIRRYLATTKELYPEYYPLFFLVLHTGVRRSELLALRWNEIDLLGCQLSVKRGLHQLNDGTYILRNKTKTKKSRRPISLSPLAVKVLRDHFDKVSIDRAMLDMKLTKADLVFSKYDGSPLRPDTVSRAWGNIAKRAGIKVIRFHDGRHTMASRMMEQGINPKVVQERMGHSTISTTMDIYSHIGETLQKEAANKFDDIFNVSYNESVVSKS